ncbi:unnamed protein product [Bursaphelenchus okinawaensis]|uniref:Hflx-type G domain-containing protein n=1 Tax=Bursaphelenchus okinawaensis TaxID=465554 RepID=A0A811LH94_9BILA|nr:unnamed protein product [Bursaphelenchus okinawaensis]CAG9122333.1 unnamed protein product [Bursaphelenchus okinawaensis]
MQQSALFDELMVPIYDRYNLVLNIFKRFATTKEALLQISLAEIPYIRQRLLYSDKYGTSRDTLNISSSQMISTKDKIEVIRLREQNLRKKIKATIEEKTNEVELRKTHEEKRASKVLLVAVIGYTNAGKTSLIKSLTGAAHICGENRLFATLDTTIHPALLPSRNRIILADTIGFISDLPIGLIASFEATLRHVKKADLLVHIQDLSHPNLKAQKQNVMETLQGLQLPSHLLDNMINVGNKIDKLSKFEAATLMENNDNMVVVSCRKKTGLSLLVQKMDSIVKKVTGSKTRRFRLKPGSQLASYLYAEGFVSQVPNTDDSGNLIFEVQMTDDQLHRLQSHLKGSGTKIKRLEGT